MRPMGWSVVFHTLQSVNKAHEGWRAGRVGSHPMRPMRSSVGVSHFAKCEQGPRGLARREGWKPPHASDAIVGGCSHFTKCEPGRRRVARREGWKPPHASDSIVGGCFTLCKMSTRTKRVGVQGGWEATQCVRWDGRWCFTLCKV